MCEGILRRDIGRDVVVKRLREVMSGRVKSRRGYAFIGVCAAGRGVREARRGRCWERV